MSGSSNVRCLGVAVNWGHGLRKLELVGVSELMGCIAGLQRMVVAEGSSM